MELINLIESSVVINTSVNNNVVVETPVAYTITTGIVGPPGPQGAQGLQGLQGPSGEGTIGGIAVAVAGLTSNDLLYFDGINWANTQPAKLTEGGNF